MKHLLKILSLCFVMSFSLVAQYETGTGTRALALANNHTALSSGVSDLYWNPAALAFSVSREFQASLYGNKLSSQSTFFGKKTTDDVQRFRLNNAGFSYAVPTSRGGMSFAGSYSNPFIIDEAYRFMGKYINNDSLVSVNERMIHTIGNLDFWTLGFGIQVAQNLGVGVAASITSGKSDGKSYYDKSSTYNDSLFQTLDNFTAEGTYHGYDLRLGIQYTFKNIQTGARLVFPNTLRYSEKAKGIYDNEGFDGTYTSRFYSSFKGAWGLSSQLSFGTITAEFRSTLPYDFVFPIEDIPRSCQASYFKTGGGVGVEIPLIVFPAVVRAGYSLDELDLHPWMEEPADTTITWTNDSMSVSRNQHKVSAGIGFTSATSSFDISYSLSTWGITTRKNLEQIYYMHRVLTSFTVRF